MAERTGAVAAGGAPAVPREGGITESDLRLLLAGLTAVRDGDFRTRLPDGEDGLLGEIATVFNGMANQLSLFTSEVTRVAREVGTEGALGGQADVPGVGGAWRDLTDSVNFMAGNLTVQVRSIAQVATAVAKGDLSQKITVTARGEILELKTTINTMVDQLSAFADEVTRVAREVGSEGRLGGQAEVEGVSGTWKRLTENVNELAGNLTRQVRAIAAVTSAVAEGDLTRSITVEAPGEMGDLKDNINSMVGSLRETTRANQEQDWLKTNLALISGLMQGHRDLAVVAELVMDELTPLVAAQYGAFYLAEDTPQGTMLTLVGSYGRSAADGVAVRFALGESLVGQAARSRRTIATDEVPADYVISSGLGRTTPGSLMILPIVVDDQVLGVIELASFSAFTPVHRDFLGQLMETIGVNVSTIVANARTDELLGESQRLTAEL
ncbi:HAMP domain-containing protein, partial [Streptomyces sp. NPDC001674]